MKNIRHCKVTVFILICWALFSAVGFWGKDTVYKRYTVDARTTPYFVLVLDGLRDGIYPWSGERESLWEKWERLAESGSGGENIAPTEIAGETETASTESVSGTVETETETEAAESADGTETDEQPREFVEVDDDYFSDAVFIGDSRTVGLHDYGGLAGATFYATVGMNVYDLWTEKFCEVDGKTVTLEEALTAKRYGKIYFQIGINEMGRGTVEGFLSAYGETVQKFRELQPDAVIFVQGIMKVTKEKSDGDEIFNNEGIEERNEGIALLADGIHIFYIDVNEVVCDEDGALDEDLTFDDVHLYGSKYGIWVDFLKKKGI